VKFGRSYAWLDLPTLDDFLKAVAGKVDLYFDAKAIAPEALNAALERHGVVERTVVYGSPAYLARLKASIRRSVCWRRWDRQRRLKPSRVS